MDLSSSIQSSPSSFASSFSAPALASAPQAPAKGVVEQPVGQCLAGGKYLRNTFVTIRPTQPGVFPEVCWTLQQIETHIMHVIGPLLGNILGPKTTLRLTPFLYGTGAGHQLGGPPSNDWDYLVRLPSTLEASRYRRELESRIQNCMPVLIGQILARSGRMLPKDIALEYALRCAAIPDGSGWIVNVGSDLDIAFKFGDSQSYSALDAFYVSVSQGVAYCLDGTRFTSSVARYSELREQLQARVWKRIGSGPHLSFLRLLHHWAHGTRIEAAELSGAYGRFKRDAQVLTEKGAAHRVANLYAIHQNQHFPDVRAKILDTLNLLTVVQNSPKDCLEVATGWFRIRKDPDLAHQLVDLVRQQPDLTPAFLAYIRGCLLYAYCRQTDPNGPIGAWSFPTIISKDPHRRNFFSVSCGSTPRFLALSNSVQVVTPAQVMVDMLKALEMLGRTEKSQAYFPTLREAVRVLTGKEDVFLNADGSKVSRALGDLVAVWDRAPLKALVEGQFFGQEASPRRVLEWLHGKFGPSRDIERRLARLELQDSLATMKGTRYQPFARLCSQVTGLGELPATMIGGRSLTNLNRNLLACSREPSAMETYQRVAKPLMSLLLPHLEQVLRRAVKTLDQRDIRGVGEIHKLLDSLKLLTEDQSEKLRSKVVLASMGGNVDEDRAASDREVAALTRTALSTKPPVADLPDLRPIKISQKAITRKREGKQVRQLVPATAKPSVPSRAALMAIATRVWRQLQSPHGNALRMLCFGPHGRRAFEVITRQLPTDRSGGGASTGFLPSGDVRTERPLEKKVVMRWTPPRLALPRTQLLEDVPSVQSVKSPPQSVQIQELAETQNQRVPVAKKPPRPSRTVLRAMAARLQWQLQSPHCNALRMLSFGPHRQRVIEVSKPQAEDVLRDLGALAAGCVSVRDVNLKRRLAVELVAGWPRIQRVFENVAQRRRADEYFHGIQAVGGKSKKIRTAIGHYQKLGAAASENLGWMILAGAPNLPKGRWKENVASKLEEVIARLIESSSQFSRAQLRTLDQVLIRMLDNPEPTQFGLVSRLFALRSPPRTHTYLQDHLCRIPPYLAELDRAALHADSPAQAMAHLAFAQWLLSAEEYREYANAWGSRLMKAVLVSTKQIQDQNLAMDRAIDRVNTWLPVLASVGLSRAEAAVSLMVRTLAKEGQWERNLSRLLHTSDDVALFDSDSPARKELGTIVLKDLCRSSLRETHADAWRHLEKIHALSCPTGSDVGDLFLVYSRFGTHLFLHQLTQHAEKGEAQLAPVSRYWNEYWKPLVTRPNVDIAPARRYTRSLFVQWLYLPAAIRMMDRVLGKVTETKGRSMSVLQCALTAAVSLLVPKADSHSAKNVEERVIRHLSADEYQLVGMSLMSFLESAKPAEVEYASKDAVLRQVVDPGIDGLQFYCDLTQQEMAAIAMRPGSLNKRLQEISSLLSEQLSAYQVVRRYVDDILPGLRGVEPTERLDQIKQMIRLHYETLTGGMKKAMTGES